MSSLFSNGGHARGMAIAAASIHCDSPARAQVLPLSTQARTGFNTSRARVSAIAAVLWALAALGPARAWACSVCGCGDPMVSIQQARLTQGQAQVALEVEQLSAQARSDDAPEFLESLQQTGLRAVVAYGPWDSTSLVLRVPVLRKDFALEADGAADRHVLTGLGDVDAAARIFLVDHTSLAQRSREGLALVAGSTLPTGPNGSEEDGERIDEHAQLGTGALGPYLGGLYTLSRDPWNVSATVTGVYRLRNAFGYQYGAAVLWSLRGEYRFWDRVGLGVSLDGRYAARDVLGAELQANTGGLVIAATPTLQVRLWEKLSLRAQAQVPVVTHLFGEQRVGPVFTASVQYSFE